MSIPLDVLDCDSGGELQSQRLPAKKSYAAFDPGPLTQVTSITGLTFDFNYGARIQVPPGNGRVKIMDRDSGLTLYDASASNVIVTSTKKYYVNFRIEFYQDDKLIFEHNLDLRGRNVLIKYPVGTLGDIIAWFPYAREFQRLYGCQVYCAMAPEIAALFQSSYPELHFIGPNERPRECYASYYMGIFFPCDDRNHQPVDWRIVGLQKTIPYLLGLSVKEIRPVIRIESMNRSIKEPYVCIAAQATSQAKYWTNPGGWMRIVQYLKDKGYRVLCIDQKMYHGFGSYWNTIPYGSENFTGAKPLTERAELLFHADFFIGLSSGLAWLAWAVGKPVVMISGFTLPLNEFYTPYRVINYHICNGCWNDSSLEFNHADFAWCPRHKDTVQQFECTRFITAAQVQHAIDHLMHDYDLNPIKGLNDPDPYAARSAEMAGRL